MQDVLFDIFTFLPIESILVCSNVNKLFCNVAMSNYIWIRLLHYNFKVKKNYRISSIYTYKMYYEINKLAKKYDIGVNEIAHIIEINKIDNES
jgi:hypothetical protein